MKKDAIKILFPAGHMRTNLVVLAWVGVDARRLKGDTIKPFIQLNEFPTLPGVFSKLSQLKN